MPFLEGDNSNFLAGLKMLQGKTSMGWLIIICPASLIYKS